MKKPSFIAPLLFCFILINGVQAQQQSEEKPHARESMWVLIECDIQRTLYPLGNNGNRHFDIKSEYKAKELFGMLMDQSIEHTKNADIFPTVTNGYTFYFADDHYVNYWENKEGSKAPGYFASGSTGVRLHKPTRKVINGVLQ